MMSTCSFTEPFLFLESLLSLQIIFLEECFLWVEQHQIASGKEMNDSVLSGHLPAGT